MRADRRDTATLLTVMIREECRLHSTLFRARRRRLVPPVSPPVDRTVPDELTRMNKRDTNHARNARRRTDEGVR